MSFLNRSKRSHGHRKPVSQRLKFSHLFFSDYCSLINSDQGTYKLRSSLFSLFPTIAYSELEYNEKRCFGIIKANHFHRILKPFAEEQKPDFQPIFFRQKFINKGFDGINLP